MKEQAPLSSSVTQRLIGETPQPIIQEEKQTQAERQQRYDQSPKGRTRYNRYTQSEKGKATKDRYRKSEKGKKRYNEASKRWNSKHRQPRGTRVKPE